MAFGVPPGGPEQVVPSSAPRFGSVSPGSMRPLKFRSSSPSLTQPSSVSGSAGFVLVPGSASGTQLPFEGSVPGPSQP
jgi:hypothetical protein